MNLNGFIRLVTRSLYLRARAATTDGACISGGTSSGIRRVFLKAVERCIASWFAKVEGRESNVYTP